MAQILVIDDNDCIRMGLSRLLRMQSYETLTASGGDEAIELLQRNCPDLILLDLSMPDRDGFAVLAELKSWPERASVPVVVYSALTDESTRRAVFRLGAADFVEKGGIPWKELARRIDLQLRGRACPEGMRSNGSRCPSARQN